MLNQIPQTLQREQTLLTTAHLNYGKKLSAYAFFKVHNRETSEDLVQDTFAKTWNYLIKGRKIKMMKAFLYHILNNLIVDEYRKHKIISLEALLAKGFEPSIDDSRRLFDILDEKTTLLLILLLIQRIPEKYRKVIRMRYAQDMSIKEMSLITGQSKSVIAVQLHRGLEKLRLLQSPQ